MQSLTRSATKAIGSKRIPTAPRLRRSSICLQCRIQSQKRLFASSKPPTSTQPSSQSPPPLDSTTLPQTTPPKLQDEETLTDLPSTQESRRSALNQRFSHLMDNMQGNIFIASQRINDLTGYSGIEALKTHIVSLEKRVQLAQEAVRSSRLAYKTTVADRASTQREVTTLLARKDSWSPQDLERFTSLYRMDHSNEQAVQETAARLADAEREAEVAAGKLSSSILSRYHEEQIWSDKIRRMSTWGTWGLMGVNVLLFLVFQFGFEPWRRRRLVHGFEEKVREALEQEKVAREVGGQIKEMGHVPTDGIVSSGTGDLEVVMDEKEEPLLALEEVLADTEEHAEQVDSIPILNLSLNDPGTWKVAAQDLFSQRLVQMRKQDVTFIALQGVATGAAMVAIIAASLLRRT